MSVHQKKKVICHYQSILTHTHTHTHTQKKKNIRGHMVAMCLGASPKVLNSHVIAISIILFVFYFYFCWL